MNYILSGLLILMNGFGATTASEPATAIPLSQSIISDDFWSRRLETNRTVTIPYCFKRCEETGVIDNFAIAGGLMKGDFKGRPYNDAQAYKTLEGASNTLVNHSDPQLEAYIDELIQKIAAAQEDDGYLYTVRTIIKNPAELPPMAGPKRWLKEARSHELSNSGHLYDAAVAHYKATGKRTLLEVAIKNADLIDRVFGPEDGKLKIPPGHQGIESGLMGLHSVTGNERYIRLAKFFIDQRGNAAGHELFRDRFQDDEPFVQQKAATGHAVRAGYLYSGAAEVAAALGDKSYQEALERIWGNVISKKVYLTGGIGARHEFETFGDDYELPNAEAYSETCAAIAHAFWCQSMFLLNQDSQYIDMLERVMYNGFLAGVSMSGDKFFYPNPLASDGKYERSPWFKLACCPTNAVRFMSAIPGYIYAKRGRSVFVNLYVTGKATISLGSDEVEIVQKNNYPWDGKLRIEVRPKIPTKFTLRLRVPGWATGKPLASDLYTYLDEQATSDQVTFRLNGDSLSPEIEKGYAVITREWQTGDFVEMDLPMSVRRVVSHENVKSNKDLVALERGPIVFCAEGVDNPGGITNLFLADDAKLDTSFRQDLLNGIVTVIVKTNEGKMPGPTFIPYYAWCHRGATAMAVWIPRTEDAAHRLKFEASTRPQFSQKEK